MLICSVVTLVPGTSILGNLLHWEESKRQHNFLVIGFQLDIAVSGFGILSMLGNQSLIVCNYSSNSPTLKHNFIKELNFV